MELKITSRKNAFIQQVRRLLTSRKERQSAGLFVADGTKLLQEAIRFWEGLDTVILTEGVEVQVPDHVRVVTVSQEIMEYISPMETPQGALFLCKLPQQTDFTPKPGMLLLDGIQDPGNIGTILRTADALDIPVALLEGCADPYSHKVVRASMGAVFRTPVVQTTWAEVQTACKAVGIPIGVTALSDRAEDLRCAKLLQMAVVIGSEGQGVRRERRPGADHPDESPLRIPQCGHCRRHRYVANETVKEEMEC